MPNTHFYVRNHFHIPDIDQSSWWLHVGGIAERPLRLSMRELQNMPSRTVVVTLERAGNWRSGLDPPVGGEQWRLGAVSTAEWTGVPLVEVLDRAGVRAGARELVLRGADGYERSLVLPDARDAEVLLAYAMNGEALPIHGRPLRVVVPRWYGMASVKWLTKIEAIDQHFTGRFQTDAYHDERDGEREPVTLQRARSLIVEPVADDEFPAGEVTIRGVAWSGAAPIARVEVSVGARPWQQAQLLGDRSRYAWQWWELIARVEGVGPTTIRARATDLAGRTQSEQPPWNRPGYGNNAIQELHARAAGELNAVA
jgi:DMSO/TMAO reductase YedYZ molybdopterin-dependent catalytic subunit